jgi:poly(3-hydroxybutyrate) depolymerase
MSRTMRLFIGIMIAAFALPAAAANGQWLSAKYSNQAGEREYRLYVPSTYQQGAALPLVVMLHGCTQNSEVFAESTGMNQLAEAERFLVL